MTNPDDLFRLIDKAIEDARQVAAQSKSRTFDTEPIRSVHILLTALKNEVIRNRGNISEQVLRGIHDLGMASYREFENTALEESIIAVTSFLYDEYPRYKFLEPLRGDFEKLIARIIKENKKTS